MSLIGKTVGEFQATAFKDGEFIEITNESLKGQWSVLFFYPADFTFICPTELGDLADNYAAFQEIGCEIYSVSTDTHFTHKAWHDTSDTIKKIKYPMIADPTHAISNDFGVLIPEEGLTLRGTFIINPEGEIVSYEVSDNSIGRNSAELLRKVQAAQFVAQHGDQVCPARWQPGKETLTPSLDLVGKL
ncbi:MAG: alkyl hydroperoxide reductase subunit C [Coriobacteriia bacterium]|nr:alkyl hydroperoxide reductase subunit C [Coriobacteriia bacterium]